MTTENQNTTHDSVYCSIYAREDRTLVCTNTVDARLSDDVVEAIFDNMKGDIIHCEGIASFANVAEVEDYIEEKGMIVYANDYTETDDEDDDESSDD